MGLEEKKAVIVLVVSFHRNLVDQLKILERKKKKD